MRRAALAGFAAVLILFAAFGAVPFLTKERDFPSSVPQPPPLDVTHLVVMKPGQDVCMRDIAIEPHARVARVRIGTYRRPGPAVSFRVSAPGYRSRSRVASGYEDNALVSFPVSAPPRQQLVTACFRNEGRRRLALYASFDRTRSRARVTRDGRPVKPAPALSFWEGRPASVADRAGVIVDRMATFRGPFSHPWALWAVLCLFLIALPLGMGLALYRAFR